MVVTDPARRRPRRCVARRTARERCRCGLAVGRKLTLNVVGQHPATSSRAGTVHLRALGGGVSDRPARVRRTVSAVPGSSDRFIAKAAPASTRSFSLTWRTPLPGREGRAARLGIVAALNDPAGFAAPTVTVRVNDWTTPVDPRRRHRGRQRRRSPCRRSCCPRPRRRPTCRHRPAADAGGTRRRAARGPHGPGGPDRGRRGPAPRRRDRRRVPSAGEPSSVRATSWRHSAWAGSTSEPSRRGTRPMRSTTC